MESGISIIRTEEYLRLLDIEKQYFTIKNDCSVCVITERGSMHSIPKSFTVISVNDAIKKIKEAQEFVNKQWEASFDKVLKEHEELRNQSIWSFIKSKLAL